MNHIYKIETYCDTSKKQLADLITKFGGQCIVRGWAVITDHVFSSSQTNQALHLVGSITDELTDDDFFSWKNANKQAA